MRLRTGDIFERYRIEAPLGEGGMGAVYRAFDARLERKVALKVLHPGSGDTLGDSSARVLREARAAASLNHPNAIAIHDVGEHEGVPYFAMELVAGRALRSFVGQGEPPLEARIGWLVDIARVLDHAHALGIVHRDIKPENVMIRDDGVLKVLDFGIARRTRPAVDPTAATASPDAPSTAHSTFAGPVGTPAYMAPEQVRAEPVDGRADQFAWGVLAYELLGGRLPWSGRDAVALIASVLTESAPPLATLRPDLAGPTSDVVARAMSKDKSDRFSSMADLLAAFGAPPPSVSARHLATVVAPPAPELASAPTVGAPSAAALVSAPTVAAPPPRPKARWRYAIGAAIGVAGAIAVSVIAPWGPRNHGSTPHEQDAGAAKRGVAITDLPDPKGCNAAAVAAYRRTLSDLRSRGWGDAYRSILQAREADPTCPAVALRHAFLASQVAVHSDEPRVPYRTALQGRDLLEPRDRDLLAALGPLLGEDPPNRTRHIAMLREMAEKYPLDAEIVALTAYLDFGSAGAPALALRATEIDPLYADAWQTVATIRSKSGDERGAEQALQECIRVAPASTDCRLEQVLHTAAVGRCDAVEHQAREWAAFEMRSWPPYYYLANALEARGAAPATVLEALDKREGFVSKEDRPKVVGERVNHLVLHGDFAGARTMIDALGEAVRDELEAAPHARHARLAVELALEEGRDEDAGKLASEFLDRAKVWVPPFFIDFKHVGWLEAEPVLLDVAARTNRLTPAEWKRRSAAWGALAETRGTPPFVRWALVHAIGARDGEQAQAALSSMPPEALAAAERSSRIGTGMIAATIFGVAGRALSLGGHGEQGLAFLRRATTSCMALSDAFHETRDFLWYGEALEAAGKKKEACGAYATVLERWGEVTTRSVTAEAAREHTKMLACD